ncbi:hypothetical protein [Promicromonospora sp. NPDC057488]|uniref:hypothetical protein n=1 Tax=Promicromonospora sp. NPDC057488 TaxID=3346147 RepID=UPI00366F3F6D
MTEPTVNIASESRPAPGIPFFTQVLVELRKSINTHVAKAVLGSFLGLGLLVNLFVLLNTPEPTLSSAGLVAAVAALGLPIVSALVMTSEWSQRTAMTTFWLEPKRHRVLLAKVVSALVLGVGLISALLTIMFIVIAVLLLARGMPVTTDGLGDLLLSVYVGGVFGVLFGVAWGAALMSTPLTLLWVLVVSLVIDLVLPFVAGDLAQWFSTSTASNWIIDRTAPGLPVLSSFLIWYVVPLAVGFFLQGRREVR